MPAQPSSAAPANARRVLAFGEVLWDQLPNGSVLGGAAANFASRVQALGVDVALVSRVGQDDLGAELVRALDRMGLATTFVQRDAKKPTGTVQVSFDEEGQPAYVIRQDVAYDFIACPAELVEVAHHVEVVYFGTLVQRSPTARKSLAMLLEAAPNATRLLDVNLRRDCYTKHTVESSLHHADILKLNEVEVVDLSEMFGFPDHDIESFCDRAIERFGLSICLVTRGAQGAFIKTRGGERQKIAGYNVDVIDTIGAGDAFTAGFVWAHVSGKPLAESCEMGVRCGALVATHRGGMVPIRAEQLQDQHFRGRRRDEPR